jgi:CubicO group peptidase (beta-lactamase class C family)
LPSIDGLSLVIFPGMNSSPAHAALAALLLLAGFSRAEDLPEAQAVPDPAWFHAKLEEICQKNHLPALAAAIVYRGRVVAASAVGVRKAGNPTPVQRDDSFQIGSITKALTSSLVARCVDQHQIEWDMTLEEMFPELVPTMNPAYRKVTVGQLLDHTSGMPYSPVTPEAVTDGRGRNTLQRRYEYVKAAVIDPPQAPPGTKFIYGGGPILVACYLERKLGKPYEQMLREQVFAPIGMTHSGFGDAAHPNSVNAPWQHGADSAGRFVPINPDPAFAEQARSPVGRNVYCSVVDLARFAAVHLDGEHGRSDYLTPASFHTLHTPKPGAPNYGYDWCLSADSWAGKNTIWHNGCNGHNYAELTIGAARDFAVVTLINAWKENDGPTQACQEVQQYASDLVAHHSGMLTASDSGVDAPADAAAPAPDHPEAAQVPDAAKASDSAP